MERNNCIFFLVIGMALLFLEPVIAAADKSLSQAAQFLVVAYWAGMGLCGLVYVLKNLFAGFGVAGLLYNLWLFLSLMSVAVGILAVIDDGPEKAGWAVWLILYGSTVGYLKRKEL